MTTISSNFGRLLRASMVVGALVAQAGCGGDDDNDSSGSSGQPHTVGGVVSGLAGAGLTLRNSGGDALVITQNGSFTFPTQITAGQQYQVTVAAQPTNPVQTCTVLHGSGTMGGSDITNVAVDCVTNSYQVGGTVTGLAGSGLVLLNNGGDDRSVTANGAFSFATAVPSGTAYSVTVASQPVNPRQTCVVANASGTVVNSNVANVDVSCTTDTYSVGGGVAGLTGSGLSLSNNGGPAMPVGGGAFTIATGVATGATYNVTIASQPAGQTCVIENGSGTVTEAAVASIEIFCPNGVGRFLLVTRLGDLSTESGQISVFAIDGVTGELAEIAGSPFDAGWGAVRVAAVPDGRFVYVANDGDGSNSGDGTISAYAMDNTTGALAEIAGSPFATDGHPTSMTIHPAGDHLYVASSGGILTYTIDAVSGALTEVIGSQTGGNVSSVTFEPGGRFAFAGVAGVPPTTATLSVNATTGTLAVTSTLVYSGSSAPYLTVDPFGRFLFGVDDPGVAMGPARLFAYSVNVENGALQSVVNSPFASVDAWAVRSRRVAVAPRGRFAYVGNNGTSLSLPSISVYGIDPLTGTATSIPNGPIGTSAAGGFGGIIVDPSGRFVYATHSGAVQGYAIDANDGTLTELPGSPYAGGIGGELAIVR